MRSTLAGFARVAMVVLLVFAAGLTVSASGRAEDADTAVQTIRVAGDIDNQAVLEEAFQEINRRFMEQHPNIRVQYNFSMNQETLQVALRAGELPDAFWVQGNKTPILAEMVAAGFVAPVGQYIDTSLYSSAQLEYGIVDGELYSSPPAFIDTIVVYYNRDLFDDHGYSVPGTWAEFESMLETMMDDGVQPFAFAGAGEWSRVWPIWILSALLASDALDATLTGEGDWLDPSLERVFELYGDWSRRGYFGREPEAIAGDSALLTFTNGHAAMMINGSWANASIVDSGLNVGRFFIPDEQGRTTAYVGFNNFDTYSMSATAQHKDAVGKYLDFLSSLEAKQILHEAHNLPTAMEGIELATEASYQMSDFDEIGTDIYVTLTRLSAGDTRPTDVFMKEVIPRVMTGDMTAREAVQTLHEAVTYPE